jgi:hypothetical protein
MFGTRILTYNREEIEKYIEKYPKTKDVFEKCGNFLEKVYLILENDNEENSPLYQLNLGLRIIVAIKNNIKWEIKEKIMLISEFVETTANEKVLWELKDEMLNDFENIKYEDIILKDYVDLVKDYFCKNN